jgi:hypothetical protein
MGHESLQARRALAQFSKEVVKLQKGMQQNELRRTVSGLVEAMRVYLSKRLRMPPGALVYAETAVRLRQHGVDDALLADLKKILDWCEAYQYGAMGGDGSGSEKLQKMLAAASDLFKKIDQCLKK